MSVNFQEKIKAEEKKLEQIKNKLREMKQKENAQKRKLQTRGKIILGGMLLDLAKKDTRYLRVIKNLKDHITKENDLPAIQSVIEDLNLESLNTHE